MRRANAFVGRRSRRELRSSLAAAASYISARRAFPPIPRSRCSLSKPQEECYHRREGGAPCSAPARFRRFFWFGAALADRPARVSAAGREPSRQSEPQAQAPQGQAPRVKRRKVNRRRVRPRLTRPSKASPRAPIFRGGINFVRVDVIVDDRKDQPVTNLSQADFEVLEDGKPQSVEQFSLVKVDGNPRPGAPPPAEIRNRGDEELIANREDVRVFVFFLDDYHVRRANSMTVRDPLTRFVQNQLRPNDIVALMYPLSPVTDLSFTRNHNRRHRRNQQLRRAQV